MNQQILIHWSLDGKQWNPFTSHQNIFPSAHLEQESLALRASLKTTDTYKIQTTFEYTRGTRVQAETQTLSAKQPVVFFDRAKFAQPADGCLEKVTIRLVERPYHPFDEMVVLMQPTIPHFHFELPDQTACPHFSEIATFKNNPVLCLRTAKPSALFPLLNFNFYSNQGVLLRNIKSYLDADSIHFDCGTQTPQVLNVCVQTLGSESPIFYTFFVDNNSTRVLVSSKELEEFYSQPLMNADALEVSRDLQLVSGKPTFPHLSIPLNASRRFHITMESVYLNPYDQKQDFGCPFVIPDQAQSLAVPLTNSSVQQSAASLDSYESIYWLRALRLILWCPITGQPLGTKTWKIDTVASEDEYRMSFASYFNSMTVQQQEEDFQVYALKRAQPVEYVKRDKSRLLLNFDFKKLIPSIKIGYKLRYLTLTEKQEEVWSEMELVHKSTLQIPTLFQNGWLMDVVFFVLNDQEQPIYPTLEDASRTRISFLPSLSDAKEADSLSASATSVFFPTLETRVFSPYQQQIQDMYHFSPLVVPKVYQQQRRRRKYSSSSSSSSSSSDSSSCSSSSSSSSSDSSDSSSSDSE